MGASVRVEDQAFADERYTTLARLAGLADADHARGKMLRLWRQCTDHHTQILPVEIVETVLGADASGHLVKSGLGEVVEGGIRIRGTKGRIEWLQKARKNGKKGGLAKANHSLSVRLANEEKEKEDLLSPDLKAADALRASIIAKQPGHQLAKAWTSATRKRWAADLTALHTSRSLPWIEIGLAVHWLFHEQVGDYQFVVQSPKALAEKWDRIDAARKRKPAAKPQQAIKLAAPASDEPDFTTGFAAAAGIKPRSDT